MTDSDASCASAIREKKVRISFRKKTYSMFYLLYIGHINLLVCGQLHIDGWGNPISVGGNIVRI